MHHTSMADRRIEFTLFDPKNKRAVNALLPDAVVTQIEALWSGENNRLLGLGEWELLKDARRAGRPISPQDHLLRAQFWFEYHQQQENPDRNYPALNMSRVIGRATSKENFYRNIITDPHKLAFILTPPVHYTIALEHALQGMLLRVTEILNLPLVKKNEEVDYTLLSKTQRLIETLLRYSVNGKGEMVNPPREGRRPGQRISDEKLSESAPPESPDEKITRMQAEIESMKAEHVNQIGGVDDAT